MKKSVIILLCAMLLSSCSCNKRLQRLRQKCPNCFSTVIDTVSTTVTLPGDTLAITIHDTAYIDTTLPDGSRIQIIHDTVNNTQTVSIITPPDTIPVKVPVPKTVVMCKHKKPLASWLLFFAGFAVFIAGFMLGRKWH